MILRGLSDVPAAIVPPFEYLIRYGRRDDISEVVSPVEHEPQANVPDRAQVRLRCPSGLNNAHRTGHVRPGNKLEEYRHPLALENARYGRYSAPW